MATPADVRRIALALPDTMEATDDFAFTVLVNGEAKRFAWCWKERIDPKKARVPELRQLMTEAHRLKSTPVRPKRRKK
jgi:hypothetical protein